MRLVLPPYPQVTVYLDGSGEWHARVTQTRNPGEPWTVVEAPKAVSRTPLTAVRKALAAWRFQQRPVWTCRLCSFTWRSKRAFLKIRKSGKAEPERCTGCGSKWWNRGGIHPGCADAAIARRLVACRPGIRPIPGATAKLRKWLSWGIAFPYGRHDEVNG